ncbi:MAG: hypothetical protein AB8B85_05450 [Paracoccaceae bacterium]
MTDPKPIQLSHDSFVRLFADAFVRFGRDCALVYGHLEGLGISHPDVTSKTRAKAFSRRAEVADVIADLFESQVGMTEDELTSRLVEIVDFNLFDIVQLVGNQMILRQDEEALEVLERTSTGRVIKTVKNGTHGIEVQLHDKKWAVDMLARQFQTFSRKQEVTGKGGAALNMPTLVLFDKDVEPEPEAP